MLRASQCPHLAKKWLEKAASPSVTHGSTGEYWPTVMQMALILGVQVPYLYWFISGGALGGFGDLLGPKEIPNNQKVSVTDCHGVKGLSKTERM